MSITLGAMLLWWSVQLPDRPDTIEYQCAPQIIATADPNIVILRGPTLEVERTGPNEYTVTAAAGWSIEMEMKPK